MPDFQRWESFCRPMCSSRVSKAGQSISAWLGRPRGGARTTFGLHVVAPERAPVVNVEPAIGHRRIRPSFADALFRNARRREVAVLLVAVGRGLDERDVAVRFAVQRTAGRRRSTATTAPCARPLSISTSPVLKLMHMNISRLVPYMYSPTSTAPPIAVGSFLSK